ncbi:hypothetical protein H5395_18410, partial [Paracoccus sp. MC1854]|uniref:hypothetical protein n=1 Tax=Paracoccus sp. MC1854 TaxID=2760306 RepID=UPI001603F1F5
MGPRLRGNYFKLRKSDHWKAKTFGWISIGFQKSSNTSELEWYHGKRAKVLVGYVGSNEGPFYFSKNFPNVGGEAENMDEDGVGVRYHSDGLRWRPADAPEWFFTVPLNSLENDSAIQRLIVHPLKQMIGGATSEEALGPVRDEICLPPDHQHCQVSSAIKDSFGRVDPSAPSGAQCLRGDGSHLVAPAEQVIAHFVDTATGKADSNAASDSSVIVWAGWNYMFCTSPATSGIDLPSGPLSIMTRVPGFGIGRFRAGQARRAWSSRIAQVPGARL